MSTPASQLNLPGAAPADPTSNPVGDLFSGYQSNLDKMQKLSEQQAGAIKQEEQQIRQTPVPRPSMQGAFATMPWLLALTAIGGATMKLHGRVMLGALAGVAKGALNGDEAAFNDNLKRYQEQQKKMGELAQLQNQYYETLYNAYGRTAEGQMQAIMMAREMTKDEMANEVALKKIGLDQVNSYLATQKLAAQIKHWNAQDGTAALQAQMKMILTKKQLDQMQSGQFTPQALDGAARQMLKTGTFPNLGWGQAATGARIQIINRAFQLADQMPGGTEQTLANQSLYKATSDELRKVKTMQGVINTYEDSAKRQAQLVLSASAGMDRTRWTLVNKAIIHGETDIRSDPNASKLLNAIMVFSNEYAKVMTGQTTGAAVSDAARKEGQQITSAAMSGQTLQAVMQQELQSMQNRRMSFEMTSNVLDQQLQSINNPDQRGNYQSQDDVKAAYQAGRITAQQAAQIMSQNGWTLSQ